MAFFSSHPNSRTLKLESFIKIMLRYMQTLTSFFHQGKGENIMISIMAATVAYCLTPNKPTFRNLLKG